MHGHDPRETRDLGFGEMPEAEIATGSLGVVA